MKLTVFALFGFLATTSLLNAEVPPLINYQGFVTDTNGDALGLGSPVNRKIVFRIYDDANAGKLLWTEEHTVTLVDGQFSILLGAGIDATGTAAGESRPAVDTVFAGSGERYIGLTVDNGDNTINGSDTEIAPRQRITSTAFALRAKTADRVADNSSLYFTGDINHGVGWYGEGRLFNGVDVNGPVLFGYDGGALGSVRGGAQTTALSWENDGDVSISKDLSTVGLTATGSVTVGGTFSVVGTSSFTGQTYFENGIKFGGFDPDPNYVGTTGNSLTFGHDGASEDFIGYKSNTFYFKDSVGGGDSAQPNVVVGGKLGVGVDSPVKALEVNGEMSATGNTSIGGLLSTTGKATFNGGASVLGGVSLNDGTLLLRSATDVAHGLSYQASFAGVGGVEGPILWGWEGGALGSKRLGESEVWSLRWRRSGNVEVNQNLSVAQKPVPVGEESLRMIRGSVYAASAVFTKEGVGFTVTSWLSGNWETFNITYDVPFSARPTVTATGRRPDSNTDPHFRITPAVWNSTANGFTLRVHPDGGGSVRDFVIDLIILGPR